MFVNARICDVTFVGRQVQFELADERIVKVPLEWFPILSLSPAGDREDYQIEDDGRAVVWPRLGERVTVDGILLTRTPPGFGDCDG
ncbi:DUF2442 domain-containing protein [Sphingobium yanoikuyae]|uniref:DUF2442 domain-containing protein n=1 Tax=Sphingobium yanoikuyae TaxID=13690 RepID=UPI0028AC71E0|nr:DUF2442 domain-containing protein [Sphingobium yanoikuyae]